MRNICFTIFNTMEDIDRVVFFPKESGPIYHPKKHTIESYRSQQRKRKNKSKK